MKKKLMATIRVSAFVCAAIIALSLIPCTAFAEGEHCFGKPTISPVDMKNVSVALMVDNVSGTVLYSDDIRVTVGLSGGLVRWLTAAVALDYLALDDMISTSVSGTSDRVASVKNVLADLIIGNDANSAMFIEHAVMEKASSDNVSADSFVTLLNEKVQELGTKSTNIVNPDGTADENQIVTMDDCSKLLSYVFANESLSPIIKTHQYTYVDSLGSDVQITSESECMDPQSEYYDERITAMSISASGAATLVCVRVGEEDSDVYMVYRTSEKDLPTIYEQITTLADAALSTEQLDITDRVVTAVEDLTSLIGANIYSDWTVDSASGANTIITTYKGYDADLLDIKVVVDRATLASSDDSSTLIATASVYCDEVVIKDITLSHPSSFEDEGGQEEMVYVAPPESTTSKYGWIIAIVAAAAASLVMIIGAKLLRRKLM